ncbi:MAG: ABC transporter permease [Deltaproteobacteria bacterium]|nr:ABC transporter permease [Deltaproteobacteria bacterium]MBW1923710.1 ABC transporter permease [Deltaproteobacteria bacterium]MBW1950303.1 ABC transporter permease [Deltaproteobacteria bacterium]MBW2008383.1 ABC transporter permease [Deltaproteobacteria bacterium]MBW2102213.1 ABC transporter permease [Deltaproteobacteria bacterium]
MLRFILRRLLALIPTFVGITLVVFIMIRAIPGDPILTILAEDYSEELAQEYRQKMGLDRPVVVQYLIWLKGMVTGDWGNSLISQEPVIREVAKRLPVTLELLVLALAFAVVFSVPFGVISAVKPNSMPDHTLMTVSMLGISLPEFFLGALLLIVFALKLQWLPATSFVPLSGGLFENLRHMLLPAVTLGSARMAMFTRLIRNSMLEVVRQDYIDTARAKGLSEWLVINKHALKNALVPTVTVIGLQIGYLIGGAIIVESLFALPGIGSLGIDSILQRDYPVVQAFVIVSATGFLLANFAVDIVYTFLDPRIRVR